jgi:hypothetical protein
MPAMANTMPAATLGAMRSRRNTSESSATTPGIAAMITPAARAEDRAIPNSMQMEKRKLPRNDSRKSSLRSCTLSGASFGARFTHVTIATAAMPNRSHASRKTGKTTTSSLDSPT